MSGLQALANEMCRRRVLGGEDATDAGNAVLFWLIYGQQVDRQTASRMAQDAERLAVAARDGVSGQEVL